MKKMDTADKLMAKYGPMHGWPIAMPYPGSVWHANIDGMLAELVRLQEPRRHHHIGQEDLASTGPHALLHIINKLVSFTSADLLPHCRGYVFRLLAGSPGSRWDMMDPADILAEGQERATRSQWDVELVAHLPLEQRIIISPEDALAALVAWGGSGANIPLDLVRQVVEAAIRTQQLEAAAEAREARA